AGGLRARAAPGRARPVGADAGEELPVRAARARAVRALAAARRAAAPPAPVHTLGLARAALARAGRALPRRDAAAHGPRDARALPRLRDPARALLRAHEVLGCRAAPGRHALGSGDGRRAAPARPGRAAQAVRDARRRPLR